MGSKGARYIELPIYVVNIGLLYALLLTSGLVLAWVTIYRHEQSIAELRHKLNTREVEDKHSSRAVDTTADTKIADLDVLVQEDDGKEIYDNGPRVRRGKDKKRKNKECKVKCVGEKGEKGTKGRRGRHGRPGEHGKPGPPGPPGYPGARGDRGDRGYRGEQGVKGDMGEKGNRGEDGNMGRTGEKGDKGKSGVLVGLKGSKGERGQAGKTSMYSESAHVVGIGKMIPSAPAPGDVFLVTSWKLQHHSGNMTYDDNGHLTVNIDGVYFVYSQMFYFDRNNTYTGFNVYIDNKRVLKAIYSIVDFHKPYHTQYISGIFRMTKGQRIWVGMKLKRSYFYNESSSFFGAFMLHP